MTANATYEKLIVWRKSILLSKKIYLISKKFPREELFGFTDQLKRSSVSIPSNIAEGYGRNSRGDFKRFLSMSLGSVYELQTQIILCKEFKFIDDKTFEELFLLSKEIDRMLYAMIKNIDSKISKIS